MLVNRSFTPLNCLVQCLMISSLLLSISSEICVDIANKETCNLVACDRANAMSDPDAADRVNGHFIRKYCNKTCAEMIAECDDETPSAKTAQDITVKNTGVKNTLATTTALAITTKAEKAAVPAIEPVPNLDQTCNNDSDCGEGTCVSGICDYCKPNQCWEGDCIPRPQEVTGKKFTCKCKKGYTGWDCRKLVDDPCERNPGVCKNGGKCVVKQTPTGNKWLCLCQTIKLRMNKDCSDEPTEEEAQYKIVQKIAIAAVLFPSGIAAVVWIVLCIWECWEIGEMPKLDKSRQPSSKQSIEVIRRYSRYNVELRERHKSIMSSYTDIRFTLVLLGVREKANENCIETVNNLVKKCGVSGSVLGACRVGEEPTKKRNPRPIVVAFGSAKQRQAVKKNKRRLPRAITMIRDTDDKYTTTAAKVLYPDKIKDADIVSLSTVKNTETVIW